MEYEKEKVVETRNREVSEADKVSRLKIDNC